MAKREPFIFQIIIVLILSNVNPCVFPANSLHVIERHKEDEVIFSIFFTP